MKKTKTETDEPSTSSIKINRSRGSGKKRADLFARLRNTEHPLDNIFPDKAQGTNEDEPHPTTPYPTVAETSAQQSSILQPTLPETTLPQHSRIETTVSPSKNFTKFSNSLLKQAIPDGLFRGQSKHTYDVLYLRTRGAINPAREIQLTKVELVKLTGLEIKTIQRHLSFLRQTGLITVDPKIGDHKGAIYSVNIPEEITLPHPTLVQSGVVGATIGEMGAKPTPHPGINGTTVGLGNISENKEDRAIPKTPFKDNNKTDDEAHAAFSVFLEKISQACERITGKPTTRRESEKWGILADLLILELETAARRTDSISSAPAFLTEVLRRKLVSGVSSIVPKNQKTKPDTVGKPNAAGEYEIKPLDEQGRADALAQLQEFAGEEFLGDFEKWYTKEDWHWLNDNLRKANEPKTDRDVE